MSQAQSDSHAAPDLFREAMVAITEGRLGDADEAMAILAAQKPLHAGAWLDLAMLYCAMGKAQEAEKLFADIEQRFAPPQPILDMIERQRNLGCAKPKRMLGFTLQAGRGYESNVNQGAANPNFSLGAGVNQIDLILLPEYVAKSDHFSTVSAGMVGEWPNRGLSGTLAVQARQYDSLTRFNTSSLLVSASRPWRQNNWAGAISAAASLMTLNNAAYVQQSSLQLDMQVPLQHSAGLKLGISGVLGQNTYPSLSGFDALWLDTRANAMWQTSNTQWRASAGVLLDHALDERPGGDRRGLSAALHGNIALGQTLTAEFDWQQQHWQAQRDYLPGLIDVPRRQRSQALRMALVWPLSAEQSLALEFKDVSNDENIALFNYRNTGVQLSWQWHLENGRAK